MESSNLIQTSTRKRKLSSYLTREDEEYYVPKSLRKQKPTQSQSQTPKRVVELKPTTSTAEDISSLEALKKENDTLMDLCSELNDANQNLQQKNVELQLKVHRLSQKANQPKEEEGHINWDKFPLGILSVETLAELWNEVCSVPIPSCSCSTKINAVAKKRVTQRITPLVAL